MDTRARHRLYTISVVLFVYQRFPFGMKQMKSDTFKSGRLLFDNNFVQIELFCGGMVGVTVGTNFVDMHQASGLKISIFHSDKTQVPY